MGSKITLHLRGFASVGAAGASPLVLLGVYRLPSTGALSAGCGVRPSIHGVLHRFSYGGRYGVVVVVISGFCEQRRSRSEPTCTRRSFSHSYRCPTCLCTVIHSGLYVHPSIHPSIHPSMGFRTGFRTGGVSELSAM